jgi:hypothetical protein
MAIILLNPFSNGGIFLCQKKRPINKKVTRLRIT